MRVRRLIIGSSVALVAGATTAFAQSSATPAGAPAASGAATTLKGTWVGFANTEQGGQQRVTFVFDSTATDGWSGATVAEQMGRDSLYMEGVKVKGDSVKFSLNIQGTPIGFNGARNGNWFNADIFFNGQSAGTLKLARAGSAELAQLLTPPTDLEDRRR